MTKEEVFAGKWTCRDELDKPWWHDETWIIEIESEAEGISVASMLTEEDAKRIVKEHNNLSELLQAVDGIGWLLESMRICFWTTEAFAKMEQDIERLMAAREALNR